MKIKEAAEQLGITSSRIAQMITGIQGKKKFYPPILSEGDYFREKHYWRLTASGFLKVKNYLEKLHG